MRQLSGPLDTRVKYIQIISTTFKSAIALEKKITYIMTWW
jgi:hypothetical protein